MDTIQTLVESLAVLWDRGRGRRPRLPVEFECSEELMKTKDHGATTASSPAAT